MRGALNRERNEDNPKRRKAPFSTSGPASAYRGGEGHAAASGSVSAAPIEIRLVSSRGRAGLPSTPRVWATGGDVGGGRAALVRARDSGPKGTIRPIRRPGGRIRRRRRRLRTSDRRRTESIRRGSVSRILFPGSRRGGGHSSGPAVARRLGRHTRRLRAGHATSSFCLAPGGVCRTAPSPAPGRLPSFSPTLRRPRAAEPSLFCGTFPRSLEAAVSGHPALRSPDFPPAA